MQVKKFEAPTTAEALKLIKTELGPDAIILSMKNHRKGFGLLSKASVEVTAAVSDRALMRKKNTEKMLPDESKSKMEKFSATTQANIIDRFDDHIQKRKKERTRKLDVQHSSGTAFGEEELPDEIPTYSRSGRTQGSAPVSNQAGVSAYPTPGARKIEVIETSSDISAIQNEVTHLKRIVEEIKSEQMMLSDSKIAETTTEALNDEFQNLLRNGVHKKLATLLIKQAAFSLSPEQLKNRDKIVEALAVEMMANIKIEHPLDYRVDFKGGEAQRVFALVGPTGVGKTTTLAKLASQAILNKNMRVGLINVDTYKVSAVDQLSTYAKILNVPFRQVSNVAELDRALVEFRPLDLVLIDTSGRSQKDTEGLSQIKSLLSEFAAIRTMLIMSATTRDQDLFDVVTRFRMFSPNGVVFSKLDETSTYGSIYNVAAKTLLPLTYFTVGQRVPEDIEPASGERVVGLILDL
ncbi:MAG: flagellar biosynthesis protein FlhF [Bacteriovoracia bacterium]